MSLVNTDIYNITESINNLTKRYIDSEDEETLALGLYGYITSLESKKIQTAIMMISELSNEVFPTKAKLDKNIITHAIFQNVIDINAIPSTMTVLIGLKELDLDKYMVNDKFIIDKYCNISISDGSAVSYDFHLDYDIIINRALSNNTKVYSAVYDMTRKNTLSDIDNPYLKQPYRINMNGTMYIFLQCKIRQVSIIKKYSQLISSNVIDNKTFNFEFEDQLADFEVIVKENGKEYHLTPVFEGVGIDSDIEYYCSYTFINSNMIRVKFNNESYMPSLNAEITTIIKTTKGSEAIFDYNESMMVPYRSETDESISMMMMLTPNTKATGGVDRKSIAELKNILPKEALSRGSITTETDLDNYFSLINTDNCILKPYKKIDNQIERVYYAYLLIKNSIGNIIPTNTISIDFTLDQLVESNGRYILPAGSIIEYDGNTYKGRIVNSISNNEQNTENLYHYITLYSTIVSVNPLYTSFMMYVTDENPYLTFEYINQNSDVQFIAENIHLKRNLITNNHIYKIDFKTKQNINQDMGMLEFKDDQYTELTRVNIKAYMVFYDSDNEPYRYTEVDFANYNYDDYTYEWRLQLETDNTYDLNNKIKILDLYIPGTREHTYGYMDDNTTTRIYLLARFNEECGTHDLHRIVPDLQGWSVTNMYEVHEGLHLFTDFSGITSTYIDSNNDSTSFTMNGIPVLGHHYIYNENNIFDFVSQMNYQKMYIDNSLNVLENSFEIDFKLFNTYGPSRLYTLDETGEEPIGRIDISLNFEVSLKSMSDIYTKQSIIDYIKEYIEDINDIENLHINNLLSDVREKYKTTINYFDFIGFNNFDGTELHLYKQKLEEMEDKYIPPEFINVRNSIDPITYEITPHINILTINQKTSY